MKPVVRNVTDNDGGDHWWFWCPGCQCVHSFDRRWSFNGDEHKPTFDPSYRAGGREGSGDITLCHLYVRDGRIEFLSDCRHELAGQTVDMTPEVIWDDEDKAQEVEA